MDGLPAPLPLRLLLVGHQRLELLGDRIAVLQDPTKKRGGWGTFKSSLSDRGELHSLRAVPDCVRDLAPSAPATPASASLVVPPLLLQQAALAQAPDEELAHVLRPHQTATRGAPVLLAPERERKSSNIWIA